MSPPRPLPRIDTPGLCLRPFRSGDAPEVQRLAGDAEVALMTASIPHPYPDGIAEQWIASHAPAWRERREVHFALENQESGLFLGAIGLVLAPERAAELGYWVGRPYWGRGYATEAALAVVAYGFRDLGLEHIQARVLVRNPRSARVLEKTGMGHERRAEAVCRRDRIDTLDYYGISRAAWHARGGPRPAGTELG
jgi:RimJ/RimL family protein N-acetyltransferase